MERPTVLHVVRDWVRPSEGFVADVVRTCTATRAVVACGQRWHGGPAGDVPVRVATAPTSLRRLPWRFRRQALRAWLAAVTLRHGGDVLHAHFGYWAPLAGAVARRLDRPWAVSLHGHDLLVEARSDPEVAAAIRRADLVIVPSAFLAEHAVAAGVDRRVVRVIPSGLDLTDLPFAVRQPAPDGRVTVTFAGRYVPKKGVLDAADAMVTVARDRPHVHLRFVGTGPLETDLRSRLAALGIDAELRDGAPAGALREALRDTSVLVTPSRTAEDGDAETLGLVNLEAQACGIPVVTTTHGGIPEAVSPDGAVLVPERDQPALTAALAELVDAPGRWPAMGRAGRDHVERRFELGARVADLEDQYRSLAAGTGPAPAPS